jgi:lipoprotein-releasing system permease protein
MTLNPPLGLRIAFTQLAGRKRQALMSMLGIVLGVAFFLAISSLMRGSEADFIQRMIDSAPHITVSDEYRQPPRQPVRRRFADAAVTLRGLEPKTETRGIRGFKQKQAFIAALPGVRVAPVLTGQAIITSAGRERGVTMNGVVPGLMREVSDIDDKMVVGDLDDLAANPNGIIIGRKLADKLFLQPGDNLTLSAPTGLVRTLKIIGLFETGTNSIDEGHAYVLLKRAQTLLGRHDRANRLVMQLDDPYRARQVAALIEARVGYRTQSWQEASENIRSVLLVRNIIMYTVVSAILVVASFGIYNVIATVVIEKRRDIAILKSMGFRARDLRRIFLAQGLVIGGLGSLAGSLAGLGLMRVLAGIEIRPPGMNAPIHLPVYWGVDQLLIAAGFALLSAVAAAWLPARKAGAVHPVDILRGGMA